MSVPVFSTRTIAYVGMPYNVCSECAAMVAPDLWTKHMEWHALLEKAMNPPMLIRSIHEDVDDEILKRLRDSSGIVVPAEPMTISFNGDDDTDPDRAAWEFR